MNNLHAVNSYISIYSKKNTRSFHKNQDWHKKDCLPVSTKPIQEFFALSGLELKVLEQVVIYDNILSSLYFSQSFIANKLGISRETVNRLLQKLKARGYLISRYNHLTSCDYKLSSYFKLIPVRTILSKSIKAFKHISIAVLTTTLLHAEMFSESKITQGYSPVIYIKNNKRILSTFDRLSTKRIVKPSTFDHSIRKKRDFIMQHPIIYEIRSIPNVNFSIRDQIQLSVFPVMAIMYARSEYEKTKNVKNPISWFTFLCQSYCAKNGLKPDYEWKKKLEEAYRLTPKQFEESFPSIEAMTGKIVSLKDPEKEPKKKKNNLPKRRFLHDDLTAEQIIQRFVDERKAWIRTLPLPSEEFMRSMGGLFPGSPEELEKTIKKSQQEKNNDVENFLNHSYTNDDTLQQTINE